MTLLLNRPQCEIIKAGAQCPNAGLTYINGTCLCAVHFESYTKKVKEQADKFLKEL